MHPANIEADRDRVVSIDYVNWRGEQKTYEVIPHSMWFGTTEFHPLPPQWFIKATDVQRNVVRDFAWKDVLKVGS